MKAGAGAAKGYAYEREVCRALSLWVSGGEKEDCLWRSARSGGRATVGKSKGKLLEAHAGDIVATSKEGHALTDNWFVECKRYNDLQYAAFMLKGEGKLASFWHVACKEAESFNKLPMLIAREDRGRTTLLISTCVQQDRPMGMLRDVYMLHHSTRIATVHRFNVEIHDFEAVLARPFVQTRLPAGARWLRPGEDPFAIGHVATKRGSVRPRRVYPKRR